MHRRGEGRRCGGCSGCDNDVTLLECPLKAAPGSCPDALRVLGTTAAEQRSTAESDVRAKLQVTCSPTAPVPGKKQGTSVTRASLQKPGYTQSHQCGSVVCVCEHASVCKEHAGVQVELQQHRRTHSSHIVTRPHKDAVRTGQCCSGTKCCSVAVCLLPESRRPANSALQPQHACMCSGSKPRVAQARRCLRRHNNLKCCYYHYFTGSGPRL